MPDQGPPAGGKRRYSSGPDMPSVGHTEFSVHDFVRRPDVADHEPVDPVIFADDPLSAITLRIVRHLADLEGSSISRLREVLVTSTHKEARITAFLTTWAYEKHWIATTLKQILAAHRGSTLSHVPARLVDPLARRIRVEGLARIEPVTGAVWTNLVGEPVSALHITRAAITERATTAALAEVATRAEHAGLSLILDRIIEQREAYARFFEPEAFQRVSESPVAARITRIGIGPGWEPLRTPDVSCAEAHHVIRWLIGPLWSVAASEREAGRLNPGPGPVDAFPLVLDVDRFTESVPGLVGVRPMRRTVAAVIGASRGAGPAAVSGRAGAERALGAIAGWLEARRHDVSPVSGYDRTQPSITTTATTTAHDAPDVRAGQYPRSDGASS